MKDEQDFPFPSGANLDGDLEHTKVTHKRWATRFLLPERPADNVFEDGNTIVKQCDICRFYLRLKYLDWGVCSNPASPFDGRLIFEHDGCDDIEYKDD